MISLNRNIQIHYIAEHCIVTNNGCVASVRSLETGKYVKRSIGDTLLNQSLITLKQPFNDMLFIHHTLKQFTSNVAVLFMTLFNLVLRVLFTVKHCIKKYSLDIIECLVDINYIDIALIISCIVLFVLIMF